MKAEAWLVGHGGWEGPSPPPAGVHAHATGGRARLPQSPLPTAGAPPLPLASPRHAGGAGSAGAVPAVGECSAAQCHAHAGSCARPPASRSHASPRAQSANRHTRPPVAPAPALPAQAQPACWPTGSERPARPMSAYLRRGATRARTPPPQEPAAPAVTPKVRRAKKSAHAGRQVRERTRTACMHASVRGTWGPARGGLGAAPHARRSGRVSGKCCRGRTLAAAH